MSIVSLQQVCKHMVSGHRVGLKPGPAVDSCFLCSVKEKVLLKILYTVPNLRNQKVKNMKLVATRNRPHNSW